jgi:hypothetical protein
MTDFRKSMTPYTFECIMFLKMNKNLWDLNLVNDVVSNKRAREVNDVESNKRTREE